MSNYFDNDDILKSFDAQIVRRILAYVRPYKGLLLVTAVSLVLSTIGSLLLPLLSRKIVDEALVVSMISLHTQAMDAAERAGLPEGIGLGDRLFLPRTALSAIPEARRAGLLADGLLDEGPYYLAAWPETGRLPAEVQAALAYPARLPAAAFSQPLWYGGYVLAPEAWLFSLPADQARVLRQADYKRLHTYGLAFLFSLILVLLTTFSQTWSTSLAGQRVMKQLRMELFTTTCNQSSSFLSKQPVGRLVTRLTSDVETINEFFTSVLVSFVKDGSVMIGVIVVLFVMSPRLATVVSLSLPPVLVASIISRRKARDAFRKQRTWLSKVNSFISEHISGVVIVKLFGRERATSLSFTEANTELMKANLGEMYVFATFRPLIEFFSATSTAVVLYYGAGLHGRGLISLGALIAFVNLVRMFYSPVQDMSEKFTILQSAMAGGERVFSLLDTDEALPDRPSLSLPQPVRGHVEFDHVSFAYREEEWVLKDISFEVRPGQTLAIVGATGAGKSTIVNLIPRLWDIQKGQIRLDGLDITQVGMAELRNAVRPVMQDVFLFSGSIAENIALGLDLSREEIERAARTVHAHHFISQLPEGYDTGLGEGASTLSAGQRQLLSFARVVAHDPRIIVLDEATSSVDTETERLIQAGLDGLMRGRTTIAIAHRLSTIKHADSILVLADGRLAEQGRHDELIARQGIYYNLYRLQYERQGVASA